MTEELKLLTAFIEAQGFKVEIVTDFDEASFDLISREVYTRQLQGSINDGDMISLLPKRSQFTTTSYKVTRSE